MYICICGAVNERRSREAIAGGTDRWKALCHELNLAQQCGVCAKGAKEFFDRELAAKVSEPQ
ncbi:MAG: (2Fe-2S)-binding protein [Cyanobacteria bacterium REEB67]|nr:(2Fe-2S)-binding protein [Cyanobacteria bacterium REEB67]